MSMELKSIFIKLQNNDQSYFDAFYQLTKKQVFYNIVSIVKNYDLSEDILQETYIQFLKNINNIKDENKAIGYLMTTSRNLSYDYFKKHNRIVELENDYLIGEEDADKVDEEILIKKIRNILNDNEFRIFILHVLSELTFEEIKKIVHKPIGTITWTYMNSLKKIRKEIKDEQ